MSGYRIGRLNGRFVVTWTDEAGTRRRYRLAADTLRDAEREAIDRIRKETLPAAAATVADLWRAYIDHLTGRPTAATMGYTGKAVLPHFGALRPDQITVAHCRAYAKARKAAGIATGSVWTELGHLRSCLTWSAKVRIIPAAPYIERPPKPAPKDRYLTLPEIDRLLAADAEPHIRLAILLMLGTAGRVGAILDLTWDRVDFALGQINLRLDGTGPRKGRAVVPMNGMLRAALTTAHEAAMSDHVVEWAGGRVQSIRKGFMRAVASAGLADVSPHVLRHTAAVHLAAAGVPMNRIAQLLGHSSTAVTERVYARFAPDHLRQEAEILDFTRLRSVQ
jgi:integrase